MQVSGNQTSGKVFCRDYFNSLGLSPNDLQLISSTFTSHMFTLRTACLLYTSPGAIYSFSILGLCAIFQAKACSRPPEPSNNKMCIRDRPAIGLPQQTDNSEQQRQAVEYVMTLVLFQLFRQQVLIAYKHIVDKLDTGNPIAVFDFSTTLQVVLASGEVPHEIAPVHPVELVGEEEVEMCIRDRLQLEAIDPLKAPYFLTRREMGIFNVGGPGVVRAGDAVFEMDYKEALYHKMCIRDRCRAAASL